MPTLPRVAPHLQPHDLHAFGLQDELQIHESRVTGDASGSAARNLVVTTSVLDGVGVAGAQLPQVSLRDLTITGGNLANVVVRGGTAERVAFDGVRLTGLAWHEGTLRDVTFTRCRIDLASFAASRLERVRFEDCDLTSSDVQDARLASVTFERCVMEQLDFSGARLTAGCVLRDCTLDGARAVERLRGAAMPVSDVVACAGVFAAALGIRILDDDERDDDHR